MQFRWTWLGPRNVHAVRDLSRGDRHHQTASVFFTGIFSHLGYTFSGKLNLFFTMKL